MKEFYLNTNPGFQRRFPSGDAFVFENYDGETLGQILDIMLVQDGIAAKVLAVSFHSFNKGYKGCVHYPLYKVIV